MADLDLLDRRVVCALQVDGRASAGRIGDALGVSARTVSRRLARLAQAKLVRVALLPDPDDSGLSGVILRIRVLRGRIDAIADALARRPDVPFVDVLAGGEELSVIVVSGTGTHGRLVHEQLATASAVTEVRSYSVLHVFADTGAWRAGLLTEGEIRALTPPPPDPGAGPDEQDRRLQRVLEADARIGPGELARLAGLPESTVRRRLDRLAHRGLLRTVVTVDPRLLGMAVDANVWLTVPPARLEPIGRALAAHPRVHGVLATTGVTNLLAAVYCPDMASLYRFVSEELGALDVPAAEVTVVAHAVKRAGLTGSVTAGRPAARWDVRQQISEWKQNS